MAVRSARDKQWTFREMPPPEYIADLGCGELLATLLYQRLFSHSNGAAESAEDTTDYFLQAVDAFLNDAYPKGLHDPFLMKGMAEASQRIVRAIAEGERMAVYGDFDTDGVTAVTLLMQAIPDMGGQIEPYIPHREREGYGLNHEAIEHLSAQGIQLLITVDCGITNIAEVQRANELGLDVIVTDHHRPPPQLPPALAVVNPKQPGCTYPYDQLVGVGIAFKLVQALVKQGARLQTLRGRDMLDVVALGTVADMAPLHDENRVLVKAGIEALRQTSRPGLRALIKAAGLTAKNVDSTAIGFMLGPRINAAGRLDDAVRAYELLLADNLATAENLAAELNTANRQRQEITRRVFEQAVVQAEETGKDQQRIVVLHNEDYPAGVVGLVAGKLVERLARPVVLIARGEEISRGSARSISTFNIYQALTTCRDDALRDHPDTDLFVRFGGHSMAAGFTIRNELLDELEQRMQQLADQQLTDDLLQPLLCIDATVSLPDLNWTLFKTLAHLEPFGQHNHQPVLLSRRVRVCGVWPRGNMGQHLKLHLCEENNSQQPSNRWEAIAFGLGSEMDRLRQLPCIDIVYTLEANIWNGKQSLQLNVKDLSYV